MFVLWATEKYSELPTSGKVMVISLNSFLQFSI